MLFESKIRKLPLASKSNIDRSKYLQSPDRNILHTQSLQSFYKHTPGSRKASSSPRYRSPTQSRLNESSDTVVLCPKCEKRSNETISQTYHESPPKIRPSHHNIVCEDCSEGSFSKVLKVVCLNEGEKHTSGTQKIKIIESVGEIEECSKFQVIGSGKSVQVYYQEVYPPPKQELTSLIPECKRENGVLGYSLKEEERKRVAIRRAEYANRVKGIEKTIITTIPVDSGNLMKSEGRHHSNRENIHYENDENFNTHYGKTSELSLKKPCHLKKNSYQNFDEPQEDSLKASIEISKMSVKHKIIAKLAGKNFKQLIDSGKSQKENPENQKSRPKKPDLPISSESSVKSEESERESRVEISKSPPNTVAESFKNNQDSFEVDKNSTPSVSSRNYENQKQEEDILIEENKIPYIETSEKNNINLPNIENQDLLSSKSESYKGKSPEIYDVYLKSPDSSDRNTIGYKSCEGSAKNTPMPVSDREETKFESQDEPLYKDEKSEKSGKNSKVQTPERNISFENREETKFESQDEPLYKDKKSEKSSKNSKVQTPERNISFESREDDESSENLVFSAEKIQAEADFQENSDILENKSHESPDQFYKTGLENLKKSPQPVVDDLKLLEIHIDSPKSANKAYDISLDEDKFSDKNIGTGRLSCSEKSEDQQEKLDNLRDVDEKCIKTLLEVDKCIKGNIERNKLESKLEGVEEKQSRDTDTIDPEKINMIFLVLTDPQVVKGLKLLGGFADYLEKNGKDVLDWKF
ncbi:hypothetical protein SteCoe_29059 [Stentor coeruleus]|uniref:Uncharacterized protein n=1 Tax=Stentor coeruleus TaxID=5963 RepID=A0A1R2B760_9CILI|nr:hypothetical protein SteCoe_29059 [Stentor coeruleus]